MRNFINILCNACTFVVITHKIPVVTDTEIDSVKLSYMVIFTIGTSAKLLRHSPFHFRPNIGLGPGLGGW